MRWFSGGRTPTGPDEPGEHRSSALKALLDGLHPEKRPTVLDLGPPLADNVAFLSALAYRVRIAGLHLAFCAEAAESGEPEPPAALLDRVLPIAPGERFDAVLAWDLFDFLRADQLTALMARLTPACAPGARFLLLTSVRRQLPSAPPKYRIIDRETLAVEAPAHEPRREPPRDARLREQPDLRRLMRGFFIGHSLLLRSGVHEYLFIREAEQPARGTAATGTTPATRPRWSRRGR